PTASTRGTWSLFVPPTFHVLLLRTDHFGFHSQSRPKERARQGGGPFRDPCIVPRGGVKNALAAASAAFILKLASPGCSILNNSWLSLSAGFLIAASRRGHKPASA